MLILGYEYQIIEDGDADIIGAYGRHHIKKQILQVASGLAPQQQISTVLHEIIETLDYHLELGLAHNIITSLEAGLFQVLTANGVDLSPLVRNIKRDLIQEKED